MERCLKQVVKASIVKEDTVVVVAFNNITNPVLSCPREGYASGEGYELCRTVCGQKGHAEIQAINRAKYLDINIKGCKLVLEGHTYICDDCQNQLKKAGIAEWEIR